MMTLWTAFKLQNCASDNKIGPNEEAYQRVATLQLGRTAVALLRSLLRSAMLRSSLNEPLRGSGD